MLCVVDNTFNYIVNEAGAKTVITAEAAGGRCLVFTDSVFIYDRALDRGRDFDDGLILLHCVLFEVSLSTVLLLMG